MSSIGKGEPSKTAEVSRGRVHVLQMLAFVLPYTRIRKPADIRVPGEELREERRSAPVEATNEDQSRWVDHRGFGYVIIDRPHLLSSLSERAGHGSSPCARVPLPARTVPE